MSNLADRMLSRAASQPDAVALYLQRSGHADTPVPWRQLVQGGSAYADAYRRAGVEPGEVVVLILQHGADLVYGFWGGILHGAIPSIMPYLTEKLSPEQYRHDLAALISVTRPAAIVTYPEFEKEVRAALKPGDSVRAVISAVAPDSSSARFGGTFQGANRASDDVVLLQHSSGTTGLQKGVALSHRAVLNQLEAYSEVLHLDPTDVVVSWLPLYHDMGLIAGFLLPILSGIPLVLSSPFDWVRAPWRLLQAVSQHRGTLSWLPNFAYNFTAQKVRDRHMEGVDLSSWRGVINCSEPVRPESHEAFFQRFKPYGLRWQALQTSYAMAENVFGVTQSDLADGPAVKEVDREALLTERAARPAMDGRPSARVMSSGRPLPNTSVRILRDGVEALEDGTIGEIALRSDCMLTGYYNRPDADQTAFRDGWYLTGDYGFVADGELFVSGRKKDLIIIGGKNVYPQDLEALSYEVPGVHAGRSVAFGLFDDAAGTEEACMVAEVDADDLAQQDAIANLIREHITKNSAVALRYVKVVGPKWIVKTSSGKTARAANKEKFLKELGVKSFERQ